MAPLLFAEEDPEARQKIRDTVVSPTRATHVTLAKRNEKVASYGYTVQDFRGTLKTLSNQTQQIVQPAIPKLSTYRHTTSATPYQKRVYDRPNSAHRSRFTDTRTSGNTLETGASAQLT